MRVRFDTLIFETRKLLLLLLFCSVECHIVTQFFLKCYLRGFVLLPFCTVSVYLCRKVLQIILPEAIVSVAYRSLFVAVKSGVTGQNIPPAELYPGILWPRPSYTPGYSMA